MSNSNTGQDATEVIDAFIDAMVARKKGKEIFQEKETHFNALLDRFFNNYPSASLASVAMGIAQLGVPYERAMADLLYLRTVDSSKL